MEAAEQKKKYNKTETKSEQKTDYNDGAVEAKGKSKIHSLCIIGQIEGHYFLPEGQKATKYEQIIPELVDIEEDDEIKGLLIILNTMGGDVEAGMAIAEMIATMKKPSVSLVLGGGHSIGVPLATAAKKSFIVPSATMTLHPVRVNGIVLGAPQTFRYFEDMQNRIINFICDHSSSTPKIIRELMMCPDELATDIGSIVDGKQAVEYGIIDAVGGLSDALRALEEMCAEKESTQEQKI